MTRGFSKFMTAAFALVLLGGVATPVVAQADDATNSVAVTTNANDEIPYRISAVETPYASVSTTKGIEKVSYMPSWPTTLTAAQLQDDDYMGQLDSGSDSNFASDLRDSMNQVITLFASFKSSVDLTSESYVSLMLSQTPNPPYTAEEYAGLLGADTYMKLWEATTYINYTLGLMDRDAVIKSYNEQVIPDLNKMKVPGTIITTYNPQNYSEENFNTKLLPMYKQYYETVKSWPVFNRISDEQLLKLNIADSANGMIKQLLAPLSNYFTKLPDGSYKVSGSLMGSFQFLSFGTPTAPIDPTPTPNPAKSQPVTVHYVDDQGNPLAKDRTLTGDLDAAYHSDALTFTGYKLTQTPTNATGKFTTQPQSVTYVYSKEATLQTGSAAATINPIAPKGTVVYTTKKIGLYKSATFTSKARKQWYAKKSRMNRPMFVVTGYAKSKNGVKRYRVKDVNHHSKTSGKTGYITTNRAYTSPVYYAAKHKTVTIINPSGVNSYAKKNLTGKKHHYRQGQTVKVKKIVRHNLTTRFVLSNGRYITANKKLVQAGRVTMPKRVAAKGALNRYTTANLTKRNRHYARKAQATFTVRGWDYSNANNFSKGDTLRYRVAGGYISGNPQLVHQIR